MKKLNLKHFWQKPCLSSVYMKCPAHEFLIETKPANFN